MPRVVLRKVDKIFEATGYHLFIYYHKDLTVKEIYNKVIQVDKNLKGKGFEPETQDCNVAYTLTNNSGVSILIVNSKTDLAQIHHECVHVTMEMFEYVGAEHTEETDELFAYYSQHVFEFVVRTLMTKFDVPVKNLLSF